MVGRGSPLRLDSERAESDSEALNDANDVASDANDVANDAASDAANDVILVETSSSQLIDALRAHGYRRFNEPRVRLFRWTFPVFFVPLVLFFVFLLG